MLLAESIVHTLDPFVLQFGDGVGIRWYGLSYVAGFLIGWLIMRWFAATGRSPLTVVQVGDYLTACVIGILLGGRIGHVLFYDPKLFLEFTGSFPFWSLLAIHHGGMSSHGGIIGVVIATVIMSRRLRVPFLHLADLVAFAAPVGLGLGRLANWVNAELPGKPLPAAMQAQPPWWSVKYPTELLEKASPAAQQLDAIEGLRGLLPPDVPLARAAVDAIYAGNAQVLAKVAPVLTAHYPNNFLQALSDGVILFAILALAWLRPRPPGWVFGWFFIGYGALRLGTEQLRTADPDILTVGPVTLPMLLSASMVVGGFVVLAIVARNPQRLGGLLRPSAP